MESTGHPPEPSSLTLWLIGSGVSIPLNIPGVTAITERVRSGAGVERHTNATYYISEPPSPNAWMEQAMVDRVVATIAVLDQEVERGRMPGDATISNYEDWYYLAQQVHDYLMDEYENPALRRMVEWLATTTAAIRMPTAGEILIDQLNLSALMREVMTYIESIVRHELGPAPADLSPLACLSNALTSDRAHDLVVLNHDLAVEHLCALHGVAVDDGFGEDEGGVRYWYGHDLESNRTKLIKPHGSINWFGFGGGLTGIPLDGDPWHAKAVDGSFLLPVGGTPHTLIGTTNKLLEYHRGLAFEAQVAFYLTLHKATRVVIAGYGFRDKGVNSRLIAWLMASNDHEIVVIDPAPFCQARPAMTRMRDRLEAAGRLTVIAKSFADTTWAEVSDAL